MRSFLVRWGSSANQAVEMKNSVQALVQSIPDSFRLWHKEIPKIPNIFILFHLP